MGVSYGLPCMSSNVLILLDWYPDVVIVHTAILQGWMVLSSLVCIKENTLVGRKGDCVLMFSFNLHVFQKIDKAYAQFVGLMLVFLSQLWMDFVMVTKISFIYIDLCLNSALYTNNLRMHSPVLIVFIHFVAPLVALMRINVPTLMTCWTQHLWYWFGIWECLMA